MRYVCNVLYNRSISFFFFTQPTAVPNLFSFFFFESIHEVYIAIYHIPGIEVPHCKTQLGLFSACLNSCLHSTKSSLWMQAVENCIGRLKREHFALLFTVWKLHCPGISLEMFCFNRLRLGCAWHTERVR